MNLRPLHDKIVVKRLDAEEKTSGGIILPENAKEKPTQGKVLAVGNGYIHETGKTKPLDIKKGDTIVFPQWAGSEIKLNGEDLIIMKESDALGIID